MITTSDNKHEVHCLEWWQLQCSQRWKFHQNDDISVSMNMIVFSGILLHGIYDISYKIWSQLGCALFGFGYNDVLSGHVWYISTLRPRQNGRHFPDDIFKFVFLNENVWISHKISLKSVLMVRINNIPALVQIMAWRRPGDKPLSEPMMVRLPTHIWVTRPQWVNTFSSGWLPWYWNGNVIIWTKFSPLASLEVIIWQLPVQSVMKISSKWQYFYFSVMSESNPEKPICTKTPQSACMILGIIFSF